jgi:hypothetical protein
MPHVEGPFDTVKVLDVCTDIFLERQRQFGKWKNQTLPDGTSAIFEDEADEARKACQEAAKERRCTWAHVLTEEFMEALCEEDPAALRKELLQVAAVAAAWIEDIDRKASGQPIKVVFQKEEPV